MRCAEGTAADAAEEAVDHPAGAMPAEVAVRPNEPDQDAGVHLAVRQKRSS